MMQSGKNLGSHQHTLVGSVMSSTAEVLSVQYHLFLLCCVVFLLAKFYSSNNRNTWSAEGKFYQKTAKCGFTCLGMGIAVNGWFRVEYPALLWCSCLSEPD